MKHFAGGQHAWKVVTIRVFNPGNADSRVIRVHAGRGKGYGDDAVDKMLEGIAEDIEKRFPAQEYELVALGQAHFNFVWRGERRATGTLSRAEA
ncbi:MAG: hypothetical protein ACRD59_05320 [Candidatus Acidiferrales bacterium]